jgi:hypothetical protein
LKLPPQLASYGQNPLRVFLAVDFFPELEFPELEFPELEFPELEFPVSEFPELEFPVSELSGFIDVNYPAAGRARNRIQL